MIVIHSRLSGRGANPKRERNIKSQTDLITGKEVVFCGSEESLETAIDFTIKNKIPKVVISGGDGFATLFYNSFFRKKYLKAEKARAEAREYGFVHEDYNPPVLFIGSGSGNGIAAFNGFPNSTAALIDFKINKYETTPLDLLEVSFKSKTTETAKTKELAHFIGIGGDAKILSHYINQSLKGLPGYLLATAKFVPSQICINPKNKAKGRIEVTVCSENNADELSRKGHYQIVSIGVIPYYGYRFNALPLADGRNAQIRFYNEGLFRPLILHPRALWRGRIVCENSQSNLLYDYKTSEHSIFSVDSAEPFDVQCCGEYRGRHDSLRVEVSDRYRLNFVRKKT